MDQLSSDLREYLYKYFDSAILFFLLFVSKSTNNNVIAYFNEDIGPNKIKVPYTIAHSFSSIWSNVGKANSDSQKEFLEVLGLKDNKNNYFYGLAEAGHLDTLKKYQKDITTMIANSLDEASEASGHAETYMWLVDNAQIFKSNTNRMINMFINKINGFTDDQACSYQYILWHVGEKQLLRELLKRNNPISKDKLLICALETGNVALLYRIDMDCPILNSYITEKSRLDKFLVVDYLLKNDADIFVMINVCIKKSYNKTLNRLLFLYVKENPDTDSKKIICENAERLNNINTLQLLKKYFEY